MVKTPHLHCGGQRFNPWLDLKSLMLCGVVKKRKKMETKKCYIHQTDVFLKIIISSINNNDEGREHLHCVNGGTICYYLLEDSLQIWILKPQTFVLFDLSYSSF